jgi:hypothetical protein
MIKVRKPSWKWRAVLAMLLALAGPACGSATTTPGAVVDLGTCLDEYHPTTPDPMSPDGPGVRFLRDVTYAPPCDSLAPAGDQRWSILVVGSDDTTIRIYFVGGLLGERCDLLRKVVVKQTASAVNIQLEAGADPKLSQGAACSAVGQSYVTQISLAKPLAGRTLSGPNNDGQVVHL